MTFNDALLVTATLLGPVLAVQAQKWIERARERRTAKQKIFFDLMATRATRVDHRHVQALNMIDLEFTPSNWKRQSSTDAAVLEAWKIYADHLGITGITDKEGLIAWNVKGDDLFTNLLCALAKALGYKMNRVELARGIYYPQAHGEAERRRNVAEEAFLKVLTGENPIAMKVASFPVSQEAFDLQQKLNQAILGTIDQSGAVRVKRPD